MVQPLESREFDTQRLVTEHPPVWQHPNKVAVCDALCPAGSRQSGRLRYSRWLAIPQALKRSLCGGVCVSRQSRHSLTHAVSPFFHCSRCLCTRTTWPWRGFGWLGGVVARLVMSRASVRLLSASCGVGCGKRGKGSTRRGGMVPGNRKRNPAWRLGATRERSVTDAPYLAVYHIA